MSPYLNYGILAWGNCNKTLIDKLFIIQKRAIRVVNRVGYLSHTNYLFQKNKILKINDLFLYHVGIFMFRLSLNNLPEVF